MVKNVENTERCTQSPNWGYRFLKLVSEMRDRCERERGGTCGGESVCGRKLHPPLTKDKGKQNKQKKKGGEES